MTKKERDALVAELRSMRNDDGGWPWGERGDSVLQASALAEMALRLHDAWRPEDGRIDFLPRTALPCGLWGAVEGDPDPSWMSAFALLLLRQRGAAPKGLAAGRDALLAWTHGYGDRLTPEFLASARQVYRLDFRIQGWPWFGATSTWVEPTAWAMVALRGAGCPENHPRLIAARAYLADRACPSGGWNYGNPHVLGQDLEALPLPTAAAVIALSTGPRPPAGAPAAPPLAGLEAARRFLATSERAVASLRAAAWSLVALAPFAPSETGWRDRLLTAMLGHVAAGRDGGARDRALALLALSALDGRSPFAS